MLECLIASVKGFCVMLTCEDAVDKERVSTLLALRLTALKRNWHYFIIPSICNLTPNYT